jgi:hypothetical protein
LAVEFTLFTEIIVAIGTIVAAVAEGCARLLASKSVVEFRFPMEIYNVSIGTVAAERAKLFW